MLFARGIDLTAGTELVVDHGGTQLEISARSKGKSPRMIVIDWSGNEMSAEEYGAFMARGNAGAHLYIDHEGGITQYTDLWNKVRRMKSVDDVAIWVVIQNKGIPPHDDRVSRGAFVYSFGEHKLSALCANSDQIDSLVYLLGLICDSLQIPPSIPRKDGEPLERAIRGKTGPRWNGVLLASHLDAGTVSPGPGILEALDEFEHDMLAEDDEYDEEEDTDFDGEDQEVDEDAFNEAFPDV